MTTISEIPFYQKRSTGKQAPLLTKPEIGACFPDSWLTAKTRQALQEGKAEIVTTTGTNYDRMQLIRPPFFLLNQYMDIWKSHPELSKTWHQGCFRLSLTTYRATEHIAKVANPHPKSRMFGERTFYLNMTRDPGQWSRKDLERMLSELSEYAPYHLDCDAIYMAHLLQKIDDYQLWSEFTPPQSMIHAYEYCPKNVTAYLSTYLDCPVVNLYGSTELGFLFSHAWSGHRESYLDKIELELLSIGSKKPLYELIVTSYRNPYMPLVRYRCGDCVMTSDGGTNPLHISRVVGRRKECLQLGNGDLISHGDVDDCIHQVSKNIFLYQFDEAQSILSYTTFNHQVLCDDVQQQLCLKLESLLGVNVSVTYVDNISPVKSGKYAWVLKDGCSYDG